MKVSAVDNNKFSNIHFESRKNKEIQKPVHTTSPIKAIPIAVLIAMSPINAPKLDATNINMAVTENYQDTQLDESSKKAHEIMKSVSLSAVKTLYELKGIKNINITERTPVETRPYFGLSRSDVYLIDKNNDKEADDLVVVIQRWDKNRIETVICSPQDMNYDKNIKEWELSVKAYIMTYDYDKSQDKITSVTINQNLHNIKYNINDKNLINSLLRFYTE